MASGLGVLLPKSGGGQARKPSLSRKKTPLERQRCVDAAIGASLKKPTLRSARSSRKAVPRLERLGRGLRSCDGG